MENMDMFDSKGTANNFPINLIVSFVNISFLFFDNNLTTSDKIVFTESSRSSSGQHFIVKLRKANFCINDIKIIFTSTLLCNLEHASNNKFIQAILCSSGKAWTTHSSKYC